MKTTLNLIGSAFLIFLGLYLAFLQKYFETISALLVAGVLFFLIGITGILAFLIKIVKQYWAIYNVNPPTVKPQHDIKTAKANSLQTDIIKKYCSVCGEIYTDTSIHDVCILCGSVLTSTNE
ncbi:MAG: hypothetical protein ACTSQ9_03555 [Candidatus Hodarchaeales archaeon]